VGRLFAKQRPWAVWRAASSLIRGSDTPWFTQLCQLRCQKMLIVGEQSLPYADIDLAEAQGIPVGIVPRGALDGVGKSARAGAAHRQPRLRYRLRKGVRGAGSGALSSAAR
jgi:hypothetical protein